MSHNATYNCPHCQNPFSINDPSLYGQQISCPTCANPVIVSAPSAPNTAPQQPPPQPQFPPQPLQQPVPNSSPGGFPGIQTPSSPLMTTPPRRPGPSKKKSAKNTKKKWMNPLIVAVAIVGIVTPVALFSFFLGGGNGGADGNVVDMTWLPENTELLVYANVEDVVGSNLFRQHIASDPQFTASMDSLKAETGFSLDDVESVTVGGAFGDSQPVVVARLSTDLDTTKLSDWDTSEISGRTVYSMGKAKFLLPDPRTVVFGEGVRIDKAAEDGPVKRRFTGFDFADSGQDFFVCFVPKDKTKLRQNAGQAMPPMPGAPEELGNAFSTLQNKTTGVAFGGSVSGSSLKMKAQTLMEDSASSSQLAGDLNTAIDYGRQTLQENSGMMPPEIKLIVDSVVNSVRVDSSGSSASVSMSLPIDEMMELSESMGGGSPLSNPFGRAPNPLKAFRDFGRMFN